MTNGVFIGGGRQNDVRGNSFVNCTVPVHVDAGGTKNNCLANGSCPVARYPEQCGCPGNFIAELQRTFHYRQPPWSTAFPGINTDLAPAAPVLNRIEDNRYCPLRVAPPPAPPSDSCAKCPPTHAHVYTPSKATGTYCCATATVAGGCPGGRICCLTPGTQKKTKFGSFGCEGLPRCGTNPANRSACAGPPPPPLFTDYFLETEHLAAWRNSFVNNTLVNCTTSTRVKSDDGGVAHVGLLLSLFAASSARPIYDTVHANFSQLAWEQESTGVFLGSPSLVLAPDGAILASHDYFVQGVIPGGVPESTWQHQNDNCSVYRSTDGGVEWEQVASRLPGTFWAQLFVDRGRVFLVGVHRAVSIVIREGSVDGTSWGPPVALFNGSTYHAMFDVAPSPVIVVNGRVFHSLKLGGRHGVMSAASGSDLTNPASWAMSGLGPAPSDVAIPAAWNWPLHEGTNRSSMSFGEAAVVQGPDGGVRVLSRLGFTSPPWPSGCTAATPRLPSSCASGCQMTCPPTPPAPAVNKAAWFRLQEPGHAGCTERGGCLEFERLATVPGGQCKLAIMFDEPSSTYWSLGNHITTPQAPTAHGVHWWFSRNNLTLSTSKDLQEWTIRTRVLWDDTGLSPEQSLIHTGFHYPDFIVDVDGEDLLCLVRTAYRGAVNTHDSNRITLKRVTNFRSLLEPSGKP